MISGMHTRLVGWVTLLGVAFAATSRPAFAQESPDGNWFDDSAANPPAPPTDAAPQMPSYGPQGEPFSADQSAAPAPQAPPPQDNVPETDPRALTEFRPTLDPYGSWSQDPRYGTVWVPNRDAVGDDFAPYVSAGHWALTEDGDWTWQSDYPFGGVVFHYGRWVWVPGTGWAWVAGRRYANAWVDWRVPTDDYGYVGWAPMPPAWGWYGGSAVSLGWYPPAPYVFCPSVYAFSYHVHSYIVHDQYVIHDVAGHTRNYSSGSGGGHIAASPRVLPANSPAPRGPTLQSAHVPASAVPASRIAGSGSFSGARAQSSGSVSSVRGGSGFSAQRPFTASAYRGPRPSSSVNPGSVSGYANPGRSYPRPTNEMNYRTAPQGASYAAPRAAYSAPSVSSPRSYYVAPRAAYSAPSAAPRSYSAPAVHYSAPAQQYSAPAVHYSAPARSFSAPSVHFSSHPRR